MYTIGEAARAAELPVKTVRYYDEIGLISPGSRSHAGYRQYMEPEIRKLIFVRRARTYGFSVDACRELLDLFENRNRESRQVKAMAQQRIRDIEHKLAELQTLHDELSHLVKTCRGDSRPDCPIINSFSGLPDAVTSAD